MKLSQRWKQTAIHNQGLVLTSILVAAGTIIYAAAAVIQIYIMRQAARESTAQVERLSNATDAAIKKSVDAGSQSLDKSLEQSRASFESALAQEKASIDSSIKQGKSALDATIDAARVDQRAWLGIKDITLVNPLKASEKIMMAINTVNSGKTPALEAAITEGGAGPSENEVRLELISPDRGADRSAVSPGTNTVFYMAFSVSPLTIESLINRTSTIYARGKIEYLDIFSVKHTTTFCAYFPTVLGNNNFFNCPHGNAMN